MHRVCTPSPVVLANNTCNSIVHSMLSIHLKNDEGKAAIDLGSDFLSCPFYTAERIALRKCISLLAFPIIFNQ